MKRDNIDVSIIIVSFNTAIVLNNCVSSIYKSCLGFNYEIIVVDNNSQDKSVQLIKDNYPDVILIQNNKNILFAGANNLGAIVAKGKYLLLLNSDTIVENGNIEKLFFFLETAPQNVACAGPVVLNEDKTIQSEGYALPSVVERITMCFKLYKIIPRIIAKLILPVGTPGLIQKSHRTGWISGCCMLINKNVYIDMGGLNERLGFYGEEVEFCYRLNKNKYQTFIVSDSKIIHLGGRSTTTKEAAFINHGDFRLDGYAMLQKLTVGYNKSILMSLVVCLSAMIKLPLIRDESRRKLVKHSIAYEKAVINYLVRCQRDSL